MSDLEVTAEYGVNWKGCYSFLEHLVRAKPGDVAACREAIYNRFILLLMKKTTTFIIGILITSFLFAQSIEIKVKDFGAIPNDKKDDTYAILITTTNCLFFSITSSTTFRDHFLTLFHS